VAIQKELVRTLYNLILNRAGILHIHAETDAVFGGISAGLTLFVNRIKRPRKGKQTETVIKHNHTYVSGRTSDFTQV
jgi:hypothetical protein